MIRLITHDEIQSVKDVILTRNTMMLSGQNVHENFFPYYFENESNFNKNLCFGLFEDDVLDCFIHVHLWDELPVYSQTIYTKARSGRVKTNDLLDVNMCSLLDFQLNYMQNIGMYTLYNVTNSTTWMPYHNSPNTYFSNYTVEVVENIPTGQLSKYLLFRNNVVSRPFDIPLCIKKHVLPINLRG